MSLKCEVGERTDNIYEAIRCAEEEPNLHVEHADDVDAFVLVEGNREPFCPTEHTSYEDALDFKLALITKHDKPFHINVMFGLFFIVEGPPSGCEDKRANTYVSFFGGHDDVYAKECADYLELFNGKTCIVDDTDDYVIFSMSIAVCLDAPLNP